MATLTASSQLTLVELAKRKDPSGNLATIAEVLAEDNEILMDAIYREANDTFSHKIVQRNSLPTGTWRKLNSGVSIEGSTTLEVTEGIGMLETYSEVDKELVLASPNPSEMRMSEARAFIEGMSQTLASTIIYGNANTDPEKFSGIATRLDSLSATTNVIGAGGTGSDTTSIYGIQWDMNRVYMIYPKGSELGIKHTDLGEVTSSSVTTTAFNAAMYQVYRDHFQVKCGLAVAEPRSIIRYANIETSGTSNLFDEDELIRLLNRMPKSGAGCSLYCNSTIKSQMEIALKDKTNVNFTADSGEGLAGVPVLRFRGCPVRKVDAITITETAIS
jgi:hypothetical protein